MKLLILIAIAVYANDFIRDFTGFDAVATFTAKNPTLSGIISTIVILLILLKLLRLRKK